jgi:hypothetical protein
MSKCGNDSRPDCQVQESNGFGSQYPYECIAKDKNPTDTVFNCNTHHTWWHKKTDKSLLHQTVKIFLPETVGTKQQKLGEK